MIPESHFHENGDGTAWLIVSADPDQYGRAVATARPCDTCEGDGEGYNTDPEDWDYQPICPHCDGTGRHTFEITLPCPVGHPPTPCGCSNGVITLRVSVVPGMVLPTDPMRCDESRSHLCLSAELLRWYYFDAGTDIVEDVTLPSASELGMWAVKLDIHE